MPDGAALPSRDLSVLNPPTDHARSLFRLDLDWDALSGPMIVGLNRPLQAVGLPVEYSDIVDMAAIAAHNAEMLAGRDSADPISIANFTDSLLTTLTGNKRFIHKLQYFVLTILYRNPFNK